MAELLPLPSPTADDANRLVVVRIADGAIALNDPVYLVTNDTVSTAGVSTRQEATVFGIALEAANDGDALRVLIFGNHADPSFTFTLNAPLFNSALGPISTQSTTIVGEFFCRIGKSNGPGSIFVSPEAPTEVF